MANGETTGFKHEQSERRPQFYGPALATSFHRALVSSTIKQERKTAFLPKVLLSSGDGSDQDEHISRQIPNQAKISYCSWKASQRLE